MKVENILYKPKSAIIGIGEEIDLFIVDIYFDSKIYLKDRTGNITAFSSFDFNWSDDSGNSNPIRSTRVCMGTTSSLCLKFPLGLQNLVGMFSLECQSNILINNLPYDGFIVYPAYGIGANELDFVIPILPTNSSLSSFAQSLG